MGKLIYLNKLHIQQNNNEHISFCNEKCNDNNSISLWDVSSDDKNICPNCNTIVDSYTCQDCCLKESNTICDITNCTINENSHICFMFMKEGD
jgi:hypothetical protein